MDPRKKVVIIGGGLAGLAAAVVLPVEDFEITLVERRPFLGGRASSYPVPRTEALVSDDRLTPNAAWGFERVESPIGLDESDESSTWVDNCQHVLMKCCTNLLDFYRRLAVNQAITFFEHYTFLDEDGRAATLRGSFLPAPFHLFPSFLRFHPLKWRDKLSVAHGLMCMLMDAPRLESLDRLSMLDWLKQHHQTPRAIECFWQTVLVSALNEELPVASARYGVKVFLDGLLNHREGFHMGVPTVPLEKLYTEPCLKLIARRGDRVRLRCSAAGIEVEGSRVQRVLLNDGTWLTGDYYLSSLPPQELLKLLPADVIESSDYFKQLGCFESSPITSVYLWYDRQVTNLENAVLLGREIQWFFNKSPRRPDGNRPNGQLLGLVVSASRKLLRMSRGEILDIALRDLEVVLPSTRQARLLRTVVMKEPFATFSCRAGCDIIRVDQKSPLKNFFVAGDWTRTGWPPTMEGAVRSSYRCAELILEAEGTPRRFLQPDLPAQNLPRWTVRLSKWLRPGAI